jgi:hypothetical protein
MRPRSSWKDLRFLYPLAISLAPVLSLLAENYGEISPDLSYRSFVVVTAATLLGLLVLGLALRDLARAAALVSAGAILFFAYGHVYAALETVHVLGVQVGRHRHLLPAFTLLLLGFGWLIVRRPRALSIVTPVLSVAALALLASSLGRLSVRMIRSSSSWSQAALRGSGGGGLTTEEALGKRPDIYYIILDGYARSDVMRVRYGFDNRDFLDRLRQAGFYVAEQSSANYMWTALSLASSLNMRVVQDLGLPLTFGSYPAIFADPIQHSLVRYELERQGYSIVAMESGYLPTEVQDADYYFRAVPAEARQNRASARLNSFETMLAHSSGGLAILDFLGRRVYSWVGFRYEESYDTLRTIILEAFDNLEAAVEIPGPKFVFAHIVAPHQPYLFGRGGEYLDPGGPFTLIGGSGAVEDDTRAVLYADQAHFITNRTESTIRRILELSTEPPVIIIQADHGPGIGPDWQSRNAVELWHRLAILNLYYLPYGCDRYLYPTMSPVNSFRLVLSCYFGLDYPLIEDKSFFSDWPRLYSYVFDEVDPGELQALHPLEE